MNAVAVRFRICALGASDVTARSCGNLGEIGIGVEPIRRRRRPPSVFLRGTQPSQPVHGVLMVEAPGIEPGSETAFRTTSTSVVPVFVSPPTRPGTGLAGSQSR